MESFILMLEKSGINVLSFTSERDNALVKANTQYLLVELKITLLVL